jgi:cellulose synthase/poly-beta-1,6-N-acetylglucosamine synthase-like glycosyltransferase
MTSAATIIVPLKRQNDSWLGQCVKSALAQTVPCEVIVVRSKETLPSNLHVLEALRAEWSNLRVLVEETADSFPGALNLGIRLASAGRIGFLLSDDWLNSDAVAHCLPLSVDIVCTGLTTYDEDGLKVYEGASQTLTMADYTSLATLEAKARYLQHFFVFRKEALLRVGGLDESIGNYPGIDDYDLIWTLLEQGATVAIVEKRLYNYRDHHGERLTLADAAQAARNLEKILRKHRVPEAEFQRALAVQSRWFGKPIHRVLAEDG